ncbi:MAG: hypothetical protein HYX76_02030 [Acidobacteria bacterium]|nr:hypothetical protein [Acidobacteriota bacterium]
MHESVRVNGRVETLASELQHLAYRDISHHLATIDRYTTLAARALYDEGRRAGVGRVFLQPPLAFLRNYVLRGGWRDGRVGFIVSVLNSYYVFLKLAKLWELNRTEQRRT